MPGINCRGTEGAACACAGSVVVTVCCAGLVGGPAVPSLSLSTHSPMCMVSLCLVCRCVASRGGLHGHASHDGHCAKVGMWAGLVWFGGACL